MQLTSISYGLEFNWECFLASLSHCNLLTVARKYGHSWTHSEYLGICGSVFRVLSFGVKNCAALVHRSAQVLGWTRIFVWVQWLTGWCPPNTSTTFDIKKKSKRSILKQKHNKDIFCTTCDAWVAGLLGCWSESVPVSCFTHNPPLLFTLYQQESLVYLDVIIFRRTILGILNDSPLSFFLILGTTDKASRIGLQAKKRTKKRAIVSTALNCDFNK